MCCSECKKEISPLREILLLTVGIESYQSKLLKSIWIMIFLTTQKASAGWVILPQWNYRTHFLHPPFDSTFSEVLNDYQILLDTLHSSTFAPLTVTFEEVLAALSSMRPKVSLDLYNNSICKKTTVGLITTFPYMFTKLYLAFGISQRFVSFQNLWIV